MKSEFCWSKDPGLQSAYWEHTGTLLVLTSAVSSCPHGSEIPLQISIPNLTKCCWCLTPYRHLQSRNNMAVHNAYLSNSPVLTHAPSPVDKPKYFIWETVNLIVKISCFIFFICFIRKHVILRIWQYIYLLLELPVYQYLKQRNITYSIRCIFLVQSRYPYIWDHYLNSEKTVSRVTLRTRLSPSSRKTFIHPLSKKPLRRARILQTGRIRPQDQINSFEEGFPFL